MTRLARTLRSVIAAIALLAMPAAALAQGGDQGQGGPVPPPVPPEQQVQPPQPPPIPIAPERLYFYVLNGQANGPATIEGLRPLVQANTINGQTLVWWEGQAAWIIADDVPELDDLLRTAVPAIPQSEQYRALLIGGRWVAQSTNNMGFTTVLEVRYTADGRYTGALTTTFQGMTSAQPLGGRWAVEVVGEGRFTLTSQPELGTPGTSVLRVVNRDTLQNETEGYTVRRLP